ncbi:hypothetical protein [Grimontia sedimenti]|uniref:hypothetical protein n=1 Tax=Grimontia sedimenti TaxID=2711294 RepID=UPI001F334DFD|nr:hypothetical protein [Grimontia sedimenti]
MKLAVCITFILGGAVNQGFSWFFLAIPFAIAFLFLLKHFSLKLKIALPIFVAVLVYPLTWQHEKNKIIYPYLGDQFTASCGWQAVQYSRDFTGYSYETLVPKGGKIYDYYVISKRPVPCGSDWTLTRVFVKHPDLSTLYYPVFSIGGSEMAMSGYELNEAFASKKLKHDQIDTSYELQSEWTKSLSNLMMWPVAPIMILNQLRAFFHFLNN